MYMSSGGHKFLAYATCVCVGGGGGGGCVSMVLLPHVELC